MKTTIFSNEQLECGYTLFSDERDAIQCDSRHALLAAIRTWFPLSKEDAAILAEEDATIKKRYRLPSLFYLEK